MDKPTAFQAIEMIDLIANTETKMDTEFINNLVSIIKRIPIESIVEYKHFNNSEYNYKILTALQEFQKAIDELEFDILYDKTI